MYFKFTLNIFSFKVFNFWIKLKINKFKIHKNNLDIENTK